MANGSDTTGDGRLRTREARPRQAYLAGPSRTLDRRINAVRDDLADIALAGIVIAPRYADGVFRCTTRPVTMLRSRPDNAAPVVSALLYGEVVTVFDVAGGWVWGQCLHDGYVGWLRGDGLEVPATPVTHRVAVPAAAVFAAADIKAPVARTLPLNARLVGVAVGDFVAAAGGFVHCRHLRAVTDVGDDAIDLALGFVGSPYVWGGRTRDGIDCSGLTQAVLRACGVFCPRDSDQQAAAFAAVTAADRRRGDLVVFSGHVGILADADTLIHATAYWMATVVEPLADALARVPATGFRRPPTASVIGAVTPCSGE